MQYNLKKPTPDNEASGSANWRNRTLFHGDNLKFLRSMNSESVDLIATDPPFNKSRDFHATPNSLAAGAKFQDRWSWEQDVHPEWVDQITDDHPRLMRAIECARYAHSDGMGAYACFMAVRLLEMRRILKPTGSIYLHCDLTAAHYLKAMMDAVFGWRRFRNEIVWSYRSGGGSKKQFGKKHDTLFWYSKGDQWTFNADAVRVPYDAIIAKSRQDQFHKKGKVSGSVWDISRPPNHSEELVGYPTQKPLALYEQIIFANSNKGQIVCDPFAGCATTLVAAERLGRQWVGIDIWENAKDVVLERLAQEGLIEEKQDRTRLIYEEIHFTEEPPSRTDDGEPAAPFLRIKERVKEPDGPKWTRAEMYGYLLTQHSPRCQGCDRLFDDPRYLELDHNTPRSDGGLNHITNRILLCSPCNRAKSNQFTLSELRKLNKKNGWMAK